MGTSCLLIPRVAGNSRVPEPPARMMPFTARSLPRRASGGSRRPAGRSDLGSLPSIRGGVRPAQALAAVPAAQDRLAPVAIREVPANRLRESLLAVMGG